MDGCFEPDAQGSVWSLTFGGSAVWTWAESGLEDSLNVATDTQVWASLSSGLASLQERGVDVASRTCLEGMECGGQCRDDLEMVVVEGHPK